MTASIGSVNVATEMLITPWTENCQRLTKMGASIPPIDAIDWPYSVRTCPVTGPGFYAEEAKMGGTCATCINAR
jgi:hypothetical protein